MITFNGDTIKCGNVHSSLDVQGGELHVQRTYFWGLRGTSEIVADPAVWDAMSTCWLNDTTFEGTSGLAELRSYLKTLAELRGTNGQIQFTEIDGDVQHSFQEATFEGFFPTPFEGHRVAGPIEDVTGMVSSGNGWIMQGSLKWTILVYE